jgi:signal transduction histidine kinase
MALKRHFSYQWQLFIPLVATLWIVLLGMAIWQFNNEKKHREGQLRDQLSLISEHIVNAYEQDLSPLPFIDFVSRYYTRNPLYTKLRVSVYLDGILYYNTGDIISISEGERRRSAGLYNAEVTDDRNHGDNNFFYSMRRSGDERLLVYVLLPNDTKIENAGLPNYSLLLALLLIAIIMTGVAYVSTRHFGVNIKNLKDFASRAANDTEFEPTLEFPHDELGEISRQIVHIYNERRQTMAKLNREHDIALHAVDDKARMKRQLTNNINHELKTPIGVIKGYLDTIIDNPDMDAATRTHFIEKAQEHADRLTNLINDISAITRLEEGSNMINTEDLDFFDIVYTVACDIEESHELGNMQFINEVPAGCHIKGNFNLLTAMLHNLAKNAAAYSKGTECHVTMSGEDSKYFLFQFYDDGIGVDEEHITHLFERFYRVDSGRSRRSGGTGLGLAIVQSTVEAHGGKIHTFNRRPHGLAFEFSLPKSTIALRPSRRKS